MEAMRRSFVLLLLVSAAITASAQGPAVAPTTPTTPTPTPAAPAPASATTTNITGVLAKAGQFNTFIRLLRSTGVAAQIDNQLNSSQTGGLTVFAPTDNAFTSLASGTLNSLSDSQKNSLVQFHVLSTAVPMSQFDTVSNPLRTQAGSSSPGEYPLNVTATGQQVNISTGVVNATVDNTLFTGDQLVVYQVNQVLLPMAIAGKADAPAPAPLGPGKKGKTPVAADAPGGADADTDSTASRAAPATGSGVVAVAMALASCVLCWGL